VEVIDRGGEGIGRRGEVGTSVDVFDAMGLSHETESHGEVLSIVHWG
jgi:hypothetical protein